jgi:hypothetical protein
VAVSAARLERSRRLLAAGAFAVVCGLGIAGTVSPTFGGVLLVAGWLALVAALHLYGRAGSVRA